MIDEQSLRSQERLSGAGVLALRECAVLENSYLQLRHKVVR